MHQETHNQFKDFGKNDHCMCQKQKCYSRALKCHFLPQMHQETHNQSKDFGKNDHCMCQKQKCYSRALKCHFLPAQLHVLKIKDNLLENQ